MPAKWFLLKDDSGGADLITPLLAALHTETAAKITGDVIQSVRTCHYDATLKLVKANVTDAERVGSLATLAHDQEGVGIFVMEFDNIVEHQRWAFNQLGEVHPEMGIVRQDFYIQSTHRQDTPGGEITAVAAGAGGRNVQDAVSFEDFNEIPGLPTQNIDVIVLGDCFMAAESGYSDIGHDQLLDIREGASATSPNRYFFDKVGHRGSYFSTVLLADSFGTWTNEGADVWSITLAGIDPAGPATSPRSYFYRDKLDGDYGVMLAYADSEAEMQANEDYIWMSSYAKGGTLKVHMPTGVAPNNRIFVGTKQQGVGPAINHGPDPHPRYCEFYAEKGRGIRRIGEKNFPDGAVWYRGQSGEDGMDRRGGMYGIRIEPGTRTIMGPTIFGRRLAEHHNGAFYYNGPGVNTAAPNNFGISGVEFHDCVTVDVGGHLPHMAHGDGHPDGYQNGPAPNCVYRGKYHAIRCGALHWYSLENDNRSGTVTLGDDFSGIDFQSDDFLLKDTAAHYPSVGSSSANVGIHLGGDNDAMPNLANVSFLLTGTIEGKKHALRFKHPYQVSVKARTLGGLVLKKGSYPNADSAAVSLWVGPQVRSVTLTGSSGNFAVGNNLEDPDVAGLPGATVTRVIGTHPTITIEYRKVAEAITPEFLNGETVNNLDDTGAGTANGDAIAVGNCGGNLDSDGYRFEADWDEWWISAITDAALTSDATVPYTHGLHVKADNHVYVGPTTAKFNTTKHGVQDLTAWKMNSDRDNVYDPNSSNSP